MPEAPTRARKGLVSKGFLSTPLQAFDSAPVGSALAAACCLGANHIPTSNLHSRSRCAARKMSCSSPRLTCTEADMHELERESNHEQTSLQFYRLSTNEQEAYLPLRGGQTGKVEISTFSTFVAALHRTNEDEVRSLPRHYFFFFYQNYFHFFGLLNFFIF